MDPIFSLFASGRSASGKSFFCNELSSKKYQIISVSGKFSKFCHIHDLPNDTRDSLNGSGVKISRSSFLTSLFTEFIADSVENDFVVFEGIRIFENFNGLTTLFNKNISIYFDIEQSIRKRRYEARQDSLPFNVQEKRETIMGIEKVRESSDLVKSNDNIHNLVHFFNKINL